MPTLLKGFSAYSFGLKLSSKLLWLEGKGIGFFSQLMVIFIQLHLRNSDFYVIIAMEYSNARKVKVTFWE